MRTRKWMALTIMKIMLVDDARSVVHIMTSRLKSYGHEVVFAENGQKALELFDQTAPDLVLMDVEMPVMNGFVAAKTIRQIETKRQWAWTPIIFLTSSDTVENLVTAIEAGGDDFMSKMVPEPVLQAKMKAMERIAKLRHNLAAANSKLQSLADHDGLTGLLNRRSMDREVNETWASALNSNSPFGLLMLDIDNFKKYNDHYGHQLGDDCLKAVAQAISKSVMQSEQDAPGVFAARYGGEEFAIVIPKAHLDVCSKLADDVMRAVRSLKIEHAWNAAWGIVTLSIGGAWVSGACGEVNRMFRCADKNLYLAKEQGRNQFVL